MNINKPKTYNINRPKKAGNTEWVDLEGTVKWAKVYTPDEFRGDVKWTVSFYPKDADVFKKIKDAGIQKRIKKDKETGEEYFDFDRKTTRTFNGKIVYFTPPVILDADGSKLIYYTDAEENQIRSYDSPDDEVLRVGEPIMIGNGSEVVVTLSVYPTAMGKGNRLESIKIVDLIHYEKETPEDAKEIKGPEVKKSKEADNSPPW